MIINKLVNTCIYHKTSNITVVYPQQHNIAYYKKLFINHDDNVTFEQKTFFVYNGKVECISEKDSTTTRKHFIDGKEVTSLEYDAFVDDFIYNELKENGFTMYEEDTPDHMMEEEYKAHLVIAKSKLQKLHKNTITTDETTFFKDIENINFLEIDDIPYTKYITVNTPNGIDKLDYSRGLYVLDTLNMYKDMIKLYCEKYNLTYDFPDHSIFQYDKIAGNYISEHMKGIPMYKQFFNYDNALEGKEQFKTLMLDRLGLIHNKKVDKLNAGKIISRLSMLRNKVSYSDVKVAGQENIRSLYKGIDNLISDIEKDCKEHIELDL